MKRLQDSLARLMKSLSNRLAKADEPSEGYKALLRRMKEKKTISPGSVDDKIDAAMRLHGRGIPGSEYGGSSGLSSKPEPEEKVSAREMMENRIKDKGKREEEATWKGHADSLYRKVHGDDIAGLKDAYHEATHNKKEDTKAVKIPGTNTYVGSHGENDTHKFYHAGGHDFAVSKDKGKITHIPREPSKWHVVTLDENSKMVPNSKMEEEYKGGLDRQRGAKSAGSALKRHPEVSALSGRKYKNQDSPVHPGDYKEVNSRLGFTDSRAFVRSKKGNLHEFSYDKDSHSFRPKYTPNEGERELDKHVFEHVIRPKLPESHRDASYNPYSAKEAKGKIDTTKQKDLPANVIPVKFGKSLRIFMEKLKKSQSLAKAGPIRPVSEWKKKAPDTKPAPVPPVKDSPTKPDVIKTPSIGSQPDDKWEDITAEVTKPAEKVIDYSKLKSPDLGPKWKQKQQAQIHEKSKILVGGPKQPMPKVGSLERTKKSDSLQKMMSCMKADRLRKNQMEGYGSASGISDQPVPGQQLAMSENIKKDLKFSDSSSDKSNGSKIDLKKSLEKMRKWKPILSD